MLRGILKIIDICIFCRYLMILPDQNLTFVTFGNTWGSETKTDSDKKYGNYAEIYALANAWCVPTTCTCVPDNVSAPNTQNVSTTFQERCRAFT